MDAISVKKRDPKNKPRLLSEAQEQRVINAIKDQMPDQHKLGFALWTRRAVAQLIKQFWGINIPVTQVRHFRRQFTNLVA